jgi:hypothetical protein
VKSIAKLWDVVKAGSDAQGDKIDDVKERIGKLESIVNGVLALGVGKRETSTGFNQAVALAVNTLIALIALAALAISLTR